MTRTATSSRSRSPGRYVVLAAALCTVLFLTLPLLGLIGQLNWAELGRVLGSSVLHDALILSLLVSIGAVALSVLFGTPLAWLISRRARRTRGLLRLVVIIPMVMPPVVSGIALLSMLGRRAPLGRVLETLGIEVTSNIAGAIIAVTFVSLPFYVLAVEAGLTSLDRRLEDAAATLGASPMRTLRTVTLPGSRGAIMAGLALAWARAIGEFGATMTFNGNLQGRTQTMPLAILQTMQTDLDAANVLSVLLMGACVLILVCLRGRLFGDVS